MRKIFYSSGLISLILLPLMCMLYLRANPSLKGQYALEVTFPEKKETPSILKKMPIGYQKINLTGDDNDVIKLNYAKAVIHELLPSNATAGFEFTFTPHAKYGSLVKLFEICKVENVPQYASYHNKFLISLFKPSSIMSSVPIHSWFCGTRSILPNHPENEGSYGDVLDRLTIFWLPAILFATMIGLTVFKSHFLKLRSSKVLNSPSKTLK